MKCELLTWRAIDICKMRIRKESKEFILREERWLNPWADLRLGKRPIDDDDKFAKYVGAFNTWWMSRLGQLDLPYQEGGEALCGQPWTRPHGEHRTSVVLGEGMGRSARWLGEACTVNVWCPFCAKAWRGCLGDSGERPPIVQVCTKTCWCVGL